MKGTVTEESKGGVAIALLKSQKKKKKRNLRGLGDRIRD